MHKIKVLVITIACLLPLTIYSQYTDEINSNRPGETMSAFSVGKSVFQVETGLYKIKENHRLLEYDGKGYGADLILRWGLFMEKLEIIANLEYQKETLTYPTGSIDRNGLRTTILGAKYLIYDPFKNYERKINVYSWKANQGFDLHQLIPAVSLFAGANFNFSDNPYYFSKDGKISPKAVLILQNHLGDGSWVFVTNIIADYIKTEYPSYGYGITLTKGFNKNWSGFIENQGYMSDFYSDAIIRGGAAFLINKDMQVDASISTSLKNTPSILYGGFGFSWRYDANYKEVRISKDSGSSPDKAEKKAEKKAAKKAEKAEKLKQAE